ncbi:hypothetical protein BN1058_00014 [Paraliobacillus sp. PM-2]|nr:hypothetical protein BN1058_00014 [Paraliobacillus sp. PM-2]
MELFLLSVLAIYIAIYCLYIGYDQIKHHDNKSGGISIFVLIPFILSSPVLYYFLR